VPEGGQGDPVSSLMRAAADSLPLQAVSCYILAMKKILAAVLLLMVFASPAFAAHHHHNNHHHNHHHQHQRA
jgi:hypothetical protein